MAGIKYDAKNGRWAVTWYEADGRRPTKRFDTESEAQAFKATLPRRRGRQRRTRSDVIDHLAANFEVDENGCWIWQGSLTNAGYACMNWQPLEGADNIPGGHRVVLHAIGQPVPKEKVVDHLCRVRHCINPDHLDVVIQRENVMRSPVAPGALNAAKTHCPQGHPYSPENTYVYTFKTRKTTTRMCRTCSRDYHREYNQRKRAERQAAAS